MNRPAHVVKDTIRSLSAQRPSGLVSWSETVTGRWKVFRLKAVERHYMTLTGRSCALPKPRWVYLSPLSLLLPFSCIALIKWKCFWCLSVLNWSRFNAYFPSLYLFLCCHPCSLLLIPAEWVVFRDSRLRRDDPYLIFCFFFFFFNLLTHSFAVWLPFFSHFTLSISPLSLFHMNPLSPVPDIASYCVLLCAPLCSSVSCTFGVTYIFVGLCV